MLIRDWLETIRSTDDWNDVLRNPRIQRSPFPRRPDCRFRMLLGQRYALTRRITARSRSRLP